MKGFIISLSLGIASVLLFLLVAIGLPVGIALLFKINADSQLATILCYASAGLALLVFVVCIKTRCFAQLVKRMRH